jgi:large subunit ribosomal protein L24
MAKNKQTSKRAKLHIKKDDTVLVLAGKYKGTKAKVLSVLPEKNKAIVEGVNVVKSHVKPAADNPGGIQEKLAPIHISNLKVCDANGEPTRVYRKLIDGKRVRVSKNEEVLD